MTTGTSRPRSRSSTRGRESPSTALLPGTADRLLRPEHLPERPASAALRGVRSLVLEPGASTLEGLLRRESRRRLVSLDPNVRWCQSPRPTVAGSSSGRARRPGQRRARSTSSGSSRALTPWTSRRGGSRRDRARSRHVRRRGGLGRDCVRARACTPLRSTSSTSSVRATRSPRRRSRTCTATTARSGRVADLRAGADPRWRMPAT